MTNNEANPQLENGYTTAFKLLTLGYSVIPSGGGDKCKAPLVNWRDYQTTAPDDSQLEAWKHELKPALWGIVTNDCVAVIDADTPETRATLTAELGQPHVATPRGGAHWYLDTTGHPLKTIARLLPGIDIRGVGGFVNIAGGKYQILQLPRADNLTSWDKLPERILAALNGSKLAPLESAPQGQPIPEGQRNHTLTSLAGTMRRRNMPQEAIEVALLATNKTQCQPPLDEKEVRQIVSSISNYAPMATVPKAIADHNNGHKTELLSPTIKLIRDVEAETIKWLWFPYIPFGKLTLLEGDPGVGKSWVSLAIATAVSLGVGLPGQGDLARGPVLIASAEDGIADTIKPRITAMHADQGVVHALDGLLTLDAAGFEMLEGFVAEIVPILLIIDPLVAYLSGDLDINKANQVRFATARLAALADKFGLAIVAIRHLTKGSSQKAIYRGLGSIDFTAAARSVLFAGADPDNESNRAIDHIKSNLAIKGEPVGYELRDGNFYWKQTTDLTYERMTAISEKGALDEAKDFILEMLSDGEALTTDITKEAKARGISEATLRRARETLKVGFSRQGEPGKKGGGKWYWKLPEGD